MARHFENFEQVSVKGRVLALAITDLLDHNHIDPDIALMALTCVTASMLAEMDDDDENARIDWFVINLRMLMHSYRSFRDKAIIQ